MNEMDNALSVLGLQLVKGEPVKLTKDKKTALAVWSVKFALMLQLVYPRAGRFQDSLRKPSDYGEQPRSRRSDATAVTATAF
jgi:hypothetical protein